MNNSKTNLPLYAMFAVPERLYHLDNCLQSVKFDKLDEIRRMLVVNKGIFHILLSNAHTNERIKMNPGDILIVPPNTSLCIFSPKQILTDCLLFEFRVTGTGDSLFISSSHLLLQNQPIAADAARQMAFGWSNQLTQPWQLHAKFIEFLHQLEDIAFTLQQEHADWLEESLHYILAHYKEELSREKLAERAGVSPEHYSRMFRKRTGRTLTEYITLIRVRKAQELLLSTNAPTLDQVAQQTGFREGLYLSRRFKQMVGISPNLYRHAPASPAALNINHSASLWALGIQPQWGIFTNWHKKKYGAKAARCATLLLNSSYISNYNTQLPDVIVSYQLQHQTIDLLKLAPVIQLPHKQMDWKDQFRSIAALMHKTKQAEDILLPIEEKAEQIFGRLCYEYGSHRNAVIWEFDDDIVYAIAGCNGRGAQLLYGELGFQMPQSLINRGMLEHGFVQVTIDELTEFDADFIFFTGTPSTKQAFFALNTILQSNAWKKLTAVQAGQVYMLNNSDLFWGYDPLSSKDQLNALQKAFFRNDHNNL